MTEKQLDFRIAAATLSKSCNAGGVVAVRLDEGVTLNLGHGISPKMLAWWLGSLCDRIESTGGPDAALASGFITCTPGESVASLRVLLRDVVRDLAAARRWCSDLSRPFASEAGGP